MARRKNNQELTDKEKVKLLAGDGDWHFYGVPRLGIEGMELHDGPCGLRIPFQSDVTSMSFSKEAVCYPSPCLTACSWDPSLLKKIGDAIGKECLANDTKMILAPGVNIKRNPLCGRNFEYLSEDPLLSGKLAAGYIQGVQAHNVGVSLKHFACNSQESYRFISDSIVDERALRELYLGAFEIAVKEAKPWTVMAAYNLVNGHYACENDHLLLDILKGEWGYEGVVISDWGAIPNYVTSHNHGLDIEMPNNYKGKYKLLHRELKRGTLHKEAVDDSAKRIVNMLKKAQQAKTGTPFDMGEGHSLAVEAAEKSIVLLKNDSALPIKKFKSVCVIGEFARTPRIQGAGSSHVCPKTVDSFLSIVQAANPNVPFAPGYSLEKGATKAEDIFGAVDLASNSDTVLLFLGLPAAYESEGYDRENILLPDEQLRLFDAIYEVNQNIIVVLTCGAPTELPFLDRVNGLLLAYLPGEGAGTALYNIISGKTCPSGRLAETWPIHLANAPSFGYYPGFEGQSIYRESIYVGYRYYLSCEKDVNYPFGYGLSYAKFKYTLSVDKARLEEKGTIEATVTVTNTSKTNAEDVLQFYIQPQGGNVFKPKRSLVAFKKVAVKAGETITTTVEIPYQAFRHFDVAKNRFAVEGGDYVLLLASNCQHVLKHADIYVESKEEFESLRASCPSYYYPPKDGFLLHDDEFERLLGRDLPNKKDRKSRPFNLNSTIRDFSWTFIGKIMVNASKKFVDPNATETDRLMFENSVLSTPIRAMTMADKRYANPKIPEGILEMANGRIIGGLLRMAFGPKRLPKKKK